GKGFLFERYGHVQAAPAIAEEGLDLRDKTVQRRQQSAIVHVCCALRGEHGVDVWRTAVLNRIADDGVIVCHKPARPCTQSRSTRKWVYSRASSVSGSGCQSYSQRTSGGRDMRIDSRRPTPDCRPKIVPRSSTRLNST